jgi:hypothetical protein
MRDPDGHIGDATDRKRAGGGGGEKENERAEETMGSIASVVVVRLPR